MKKKIYTIGYTTFDIDNFIFAKSNKKLSVDSMA